MSLDLGMASASQNQQRYADSQPYSRPVEDHHSLARAGADAPPALRVVDGQLKHRVIRTTRILRYHQAGGPLS